MDEFVYLVESDPKNRALIESRLNVAGFRVQLMARAQEFLDRHGKTACGCLVLDWRPDGLETCAAMTSMSPAFEWRLPVVVMTSDRRVAEVVVAMRAGAHHVALAPLEFPAFIEEIRVALELDRARARRRFAAIAARERLATLSQDESDVLRHVLAGFANKQTAVATGMGLRTVEKRRHAIGEKLAAYTVPDLVRLAIASGDPLWMTPPEPRAIYREFRVETRAGS